MRLRTYDYECSQCGEFTEALLLDLNEEDPDEQSCPHCGGLLLRLFGCTNMMLASFPDGVRTDLRDLKEQFKLEDRLMDARGSERDDIKRELRDRRSK